VIVFAVIDDSDLMNRFKKHSEEFIQIRDFLKKQENVLRNSRWN